MKKIQEILNKKLFSIFLTYGVLMSVLFAVISMLLFFIFHGSLPIMALIIFFIIAFVGLAGNILVVLGILGLTVIFLNHFFSVKREETKDKWWHRLHDVLIWASTAIVFVSLFISFFSDYKESAYLGIPVSNWDLIGMFLAGILITACWYILWESVIYRAIIYIKYGTKK
jgi:membrane-bound ClpP family serine protease